MKFLLALLVLASSPAFAEAPKNIRCGVLAGEENEVAVVSIEESHGFLFREFLGGRFKVDLLLSDNNTRIRTVGIKNLVTGMRLQASGYSIHLFNEQDPSQSLSVACRLE